MKRKFIFLVLLATFIMYGCNNANDNLMVNSSEEAVNSSEDSTTSVEPKEEGAGAELEVSGQLPYDYLENNHQKIEIGDLYEVQELSIFDGVVDRYDVILTGEAHGVAKNYDVYFELVKYFQRESDTLYLLCEAGYGSTALIDLFVQTGNYEYLDRVMDGLKGTQAWSKNEYEFWEKIHAYNSSLEENKKIKLIGIDIEHQRQVSMYYLAMIEAEGKMSDRIKPQVESFRESVNGELERVEAGELAIQFRKDIQPYIEDYRVYYGENFPEFKFLLNNIADTAVIYKSLVGGNVSEFDNKRESMIYNAFKYVYDTNPEGLYLGEWGADHMYQEDIKSYLSGIGRFAMRLNYDESPVSGRVLSIPYGYYNCKALDGYWSTGSYHQYPVASYVEDLWVLNEHAEGDFTAYNLINEGSPFKNDRKHFVGRTIKGDPTVTTDYFQYIILIKGSEASEPYGNE